MIHAETVAFILCSRPESSRLPEKVFQKAGGVPILRLIADRVASFHVRRVLALPRIISASAKYDAAYSSLWPYETFYGSDTSPLHRMAEFLDANPKVEWVIRATHDDPIPDHEEAMRLLHECYERGAGYGVTTNIIAGAGVEVIHRDNLLAAASMYEDTEFVSYFVRGEGMPRPVVVRLGARFGVCSEARLTVDYPADLDVLRAVLGAVGRNARTETIVSFLESSPARHWNKLPGLTIYTCAHNAERFVQKAVVSALKVAEMVDGEFILVDDGSTDATLAAAMSVMDPKRSRVIVNGANLGLASSSNIAVAAARGRWVMRLDADDYIDSPDEVAVILRAAEKAGQQFVYPAYRIESEDGFSHPQDPADKHHAGCALMDRAALNEMRFRDGLRHWDSAELHRRLVSRGLEVGYWPAPVWVYTKRAGQMSEMNPERERARERLGL